MQHLAHPGPTLVRTGAGSTRQTAFHGGVGCLVAVLLACGGISAAAEQGKSAAKAKAASQHPQPASADNEAKVLRKIVEGKIVSVTRRSISVEYEMKGEFIELLLPLGAGVIVEGASSLADLKNGDRVKVGVEQTYQDDSSGERIILKTEALVVALIGPAADAAAVKEASSVQ